MALEMTLKLSAPGMTSLHKAGLAGLYMTLKAFDKNDVEIEGLTWKLEDNQITLSWTDETPKKAFDKLVKKSFWIDDNGFIRLYGLEPRQEMTLEQRHLLYQSLLNSFLQYGKHRQKKGKTDLGYEIDEKKIWIKDFEPLTDFVHQKTSENWFDNKGFFISEVEVPGWLYPGASKRHNAHTNSIDIPTKSHRGSPPVKCSLQKLSTDDAAELN
jgi:CRISPR-associated protein Cas8a1/Csx13